MPENFVNVQILQMKGDARSDANEANDMQKLVFAYLSRRASHLCKPGMTAGGARGGVSVAGILHKGIGRSTLCGYAGFARLAIVGLLVLRFQI